MSDLTEFMWVSDYMANAIRLAAKTQWLIDHPEGRQLGVCGRDVRVSPTRVDKCDGNLTVYSGAPFCRKCGPWRHTQPPFKGHKKLTKAQAAGYRTNEEQSRAESLLTDDFQPKTPACHMWPLPMMPATIEDLFYWQDCRCAVCGSDDGTVEDHDHKTGLTRGYLCRGCNGQEPGATSPKFNAYRRHPPTSMLGVFHLYTGRGWNAGVPDWDRLNLADLSHAERLAAWLAKQAPPDGDDGANAPI